jgi:hypothetical protein
MSICICAADSVTRSTKLYGTLVIVLVLLAGFVMDYMFPYADILGRVMGRKIIPGI